MRFRQFQPSIDDTGDWRHHRARRCLLDRGLYRIGNAFKTEHPDANVVLSFDASSALVTQIYEGAPADVFASADEANMKKLTDAGGNAGEPQIFATNSLQIIVGIGNPKGITGVADLAKPGLLYVTCSPEVPIGKYAAQVLTAANVTVTPVCSSRTSRASSPR